MVCDIDEAVLILYGLKKRTRETGPVDLMLQGSYCVFLFTVILTYLLDKTGNFLEFFASL